MDKDFWSKLAKDNPYGVSFLPNSLRLWHRRAGVGFDEAETLLKPDMLQLGDLWFCREMLADEAQWREIDAIAANALERHGFFSAGYFRGAIQNLAKNINTDADAFALLDFMGYDTADFEGVKFCVADKFLPSLAEYLDEEEFERGGPQGALDVILPELGAKLYKLLEQNGKLWPADLVAGAFASLDPLALEKLRAACLPDVRVQDEQGLAVWIMPDSLALPDDFSEKITYVIDVLLRLNRTLGALTLGNALDILYGEDFRAEYDLKDDVAFLGQCQRAYDGEAKIRADYRRKTLKSGSARAVQQIRAQDDNLARDKNGNLIIGLKEKPLCVKSWRNLLRASAKPEIKDWIQRLEKGESLEQLAFASGYEIKSFSWYIRTYKTYLRVAAKNKLE